MIENYQLSYFLAVVETGSFTKAAKRVFVTQPTLSAGIKKLEQDLGKKLFNRTSKWVFLTESGTRFLPHAKSILYQLNLAEADIKSTGQWTINLADEYRQFIGRYHDPFNAACAGCITCKSENYKIGKNCHHRWAKNVCRYWYRYNGRELVWL